MNIDDALKKLHNDKIFSIKFIRQHDKIENGVVVEPAGTIVKRTARLGVRKGVKGTGTPPPPDIVIIYDTKNGFRRIRKNSIIEIHQNGIIFKHHRPVAQ